MRLVQFQTLRSGLQRNAAPVTSQVRKVLEAGLREELLAAGVFEDVEVGSSDDQDRLLLALCSFRGDVADDEAASALEGAWAALAFHHWSAHAFLTEQGHVELQAASLDRPGGHFVSVHIIAQRAGAPAADLLDAGDAVAVPFRRDPDRAPSQVILAHTA